MKLPLVLSCPLLFSVVLLTVALLSSVVLGCPLLFCVVLCCPLLSSVLFCWLLFSSVVLRPPLSSVVLCCSLLSSVVLCCPPSSSVLLRRPGQGDGEVPRLRRTLRPSTHSSHLVCNPHCPFLPQRGNPPCVTVLLTTYVAYELLTQLGSPGRWLRHGCKSRLDCDTLFCSAYPSRPKTEPSARTAGRAISAAVQRGGGGSGQDTEAQKQSKGTAPTPAPPCSGDRYPLLLAGALQLQGSFSVALR